MPTEVFRGNKQKKIPGFYWITGLILKKTQRQVETTTLNNAALRLNHVVNSGKISEVIFLLKLGKQSRSSYIALILFMSNNEIMFIKRLKDKFQGINLDL